MRKVFKRDKFTVVKDNGHISLSSACIRANKTGFFALAERVNPESYDGTDTNIDPNDCFFGGRRVELAVRLQDATKAAALGREKDNPADPQPEASGGEGNKTE